MSQNKSSRETWRTTCSGYYREYTKSPVNITETNVLAATETVSYGANLKDWRQRIKNGQDATTSLNGTRYSYRSGIGYAWSTPKNTANNWTYYRAGNLWKNQLTIPTSIYADLEATARSAAQIAFAKKVRQRTQNWAGGVFAGELLQTAQMLQNPLRSLRRESTSLLRQIMTLKRRFATTQGDRAKAAILKQISDLWLVWSFGVRPTVNDLTEAAVAFDRLTNGKARHDSLIVRASGDATRYVPGSETTMNALTGFPGDMYCRISDYQHSSVRYIGKIRGMNPSGEMPALTQVGFDLSSILPTGWELVPWSWLVDYFVNINDVLDAWSMRFIDFSFLVETTKSVRNFRPESFRMAQDNASYSYRSEILRQPSARMITVARKSVSPNFAPEPSVRIPGFPSTKWLNIAALTTSRSAASIPTGWAWSKRRGYYRQ